MKRLFVLIACIATVQFSFAQDSIEVYPSNWWVGMKNKKLQLLLHSKNISGNGRRSASTTYPGIKITSTEKLESPDYLVINLELMPSVKPGIIQFSINSVDMAVKQFNLELKPRRKGNGTEYAQGVRSEDFMYLIMPDRFANGDYNNDKLPGYKDQSLNRDSMYHRHGGDIQGVIDHLDYLRIWV